MPMKDNIFSRTTKNRIAVCVLLFLIIIYVFASITAETHKETWWHELVTDLIPNLLSSLIAFISIYWFFVYKENEQSDSELIREITKTVTCNKI
jgi:uncharacterized membrane protein